MLIPISIWAIIFVSLAYLIARQVFLMGIKEGRLQITKENRIVFKNYEKELKENRETIENLNKKIIELEDNILDR